MGLEDVFVFIYCLLSFSQVKNFKEYCELYLKDREDDAGNLIKVFYENVNDRWEVAVALSDKDSFQQVSFVNSIATTKVLVHEKLSLCC